VYFERRYGIRTTGFKTSQSVKYHHYQAAAYSVLKRVFNEIKPLTTGYAFYDIGCGKGRVLFMAAETGYKKLYGIELDASLMEEAKQNLKSQLIKEMAPKIHFEQKNVLEYTFENQSSVYFLFNPFNAEVMKGFVDRVLSSNKQGCYFVYMNPLFSKVFENKGIQVHKVIRSFLYTEAIIYRVPMRVE
jgi:SAM-dependent methyltransferase